MKTLRELQAEALANEEKLKGVQWDSLSPEQETAALALVEEGERLEREIAAARERESNLAAARQRAAALQGRNSGSAGSPFAAASDAGAYVPGLGAQPGAQRGGGMPALPATALLARPRHFKAREGQSAQLQAYRFARWFLASCRNHGPSRRYCQEHGIPLIAVDGDGVQLAHHSEAINADGGFLVAPEFENTMIDLREQYGVFRKYARRSPMAAETKSRPRRTGGVIGYFIGEGDTIPDSKKGWDRVKLTARKLGALTYISNELNDDTMVDLGDDLMYEIGYAFAVKEDQCGFVGDGTSAYGNITGACTKLKGLSNTIANIAGLKVGTGNAYSELTLNDFIDTAALLPEYARRQPDCAWFVHSNFFDGTMQKLALAAGGVTEAMIVAGISQQRFLGYPVVFAQAMPRQEANSQVCALLGSLSLAADFGDRRQTTLAVDSSVAFAEDELAIRGIERFDISVHSVGNASGTASQRQPGPLVGLITAAS